MTVRTHLMFLGQACSAIDESNASGVFLLDDVNDDTAVPCYDIYGDTPDMERIKAMFNDFPGRHRFAGLATHANFSPTPHGESALAWCLVTVERAGLARLAVRRIKEDEKWSLIDFSDAPWFAASTASAIRGMLDGDFSGPFKTVGDPRLLDRVRDSNAPTIDAEGRL